MEAAIGDRALVHPRLEDRADRAPELVLRVLRKGRAALALDDDLVVADQLRPVVAGEVGVEVVAALVLEVLEPLLEAVVVDAEHDVGIHLDEAAVGIVGEALVGAAPRAPRPSASLRPRLRMVSIIPGIEARAPERTERRSGRSSPPSVLPVICSMPARAASTSASKVGRVAPAVGVVVRADLGGDGEARRHRQAEIGHLGEVCALAAEEIAHLRLALGFAVAEAVDPLRHSRCPRWRAPPRAVASP